MCQKSPVIRMPDGVRKWSVVLTSDVKRRVCSVMSPTSAESGAYVRYPEQQAQLATQAGTNPERLATNVAARYLDEEARFLPLLKKA